MKKLYIILITLFAFSCSDMYVIPETHYIIQEGDHKSQVVGGFFGDKMRSLKSDHFSFTARFDETVVYDLHNENQHDINKLMGFADANNMHQDNSIRFGWCYNLETGKVDIFGYAYLDGERFYKRITDVAVGETAQYDIYLTDESYELTVNGTHDLSIPRKVKNNRGIYYMLFPYFGGNEVAPHDINIFIKEKM